MRPIWMLPVLVVCLMLLSPPGSPAAAPENGCDGVKSRECCSEGQPGAPGDCADLIISHRYDQCAFVDEIEGCKPPLEWTRQPHGRKAQSWLCPASYEWVADKDCAGEDSDDATGGLALPCLGTALVAPALLIVWLAIRRNS